MSIGGTARAALLGLAMTALPAAGASAKTLVFCSEGDPEGFDPALYTSETTFDASSRQVYNRLVELRLGTTEIEPALAESWDISDDGTQYTFRLRRGVSFHASGRFQPTRGFNADDVVFSFARQHDSSHPYYGYGGEWEYFLGMSMATLIDSVEKIDDHTVRFNLSRPEAPMLANLAMDFASILSAEYAGRLLEAGTPELLDREPVGTGPFQLIAYEPGAAIRYQSHPGYWRARAAIDDLVFAITPDASVRWQRLAAGECHVMAYPDPAEIEQMQADPAVEVLEQDGLNVGYLAYNTRQAPFDNVNVRKALNMAINKQAILDAVFQGTGIVAKNPIPPAMWSYNHEVEDDPYDPEAARTMLADAGVENLRMRIWAMPVQRPYNPNPRRMAELLQADFARIGVDSEIVSFDWAEYLERSRAIDRDGSVLLGWTADSGDPDNFLAVLLGCDAVGGSNRAQWCYEPFEELIQQAKRIHDREARAELYARAQTIFKEQAPWATIAHAVVIKPVRREVEGFIVDPFGGHSFYGVDLAE
jgi:dipeptide transport system substrate-binding protein